MSQPNDTASDQENDAEKSNSGPEQEEEVGEEPFVLPPHLEKLARREDRKSDRKIEKENKQAAVKEEKWWARAVNRITHFIDDEAAEDAEEEGIAVPADDAPVTNPITKYFSFTKAK